MVISVGASMSIYFVKYSTITKMKCLSLEALGNGLNMFMPHWEKRHGDAMMIISINGW